MTQLIHSPIPPAQRLALRAGDCVRLSGVLYTGRDAAHQRMAQLLSRGEDLPVDLVGQTIYYVGPCPAPPSMPIGSCGPTTSGRVDRYTPTLLDRGLAAMIGKGQRSSEVIEAMARNLAIYLAATGGAGALLASCVRQADPVAFPDLGPEAIYRLEVEGFPLVVAIDVLGNNLYESGPQQYRS